MLDDRAIFNYLQIRKSGYKVLAPKNEANKQATRIAWSPELSRCPSAQEELSQVANQDVSVVEVKRKLTYTSSNLFYLIVQESAENEK